MQLASWTLYRGLPRPVRLLLAGTLVNRVGTFIFPYTALVLRDRWGMPQPAIGMVLFTFGAGSLLGLYLGGRLADRIGRRPTMLLGLFGGALAGGALAFAPDPVVFACLLFAFGLLSDLFRPASASLIGDLLPSNRRATGFAALRTAVNLGWAIGLATGGFLAAHSPVFLFVGDAITMATFGLIVWIGVPEPARAAVARGPLRAPSPSALIPILRDRVAMTVVFASLVSAIAFTTWVTVLPLTVTETAGESAAVYGLIMAWNGLLIALAEMPIVHRLARRRRLRLAALGLVLEGVATAMVGLHAHWAWYVLAITVWTAGEILTLPHLMAFLTDWAPPSMRAQYISVKQGSWNLAAAINPLVSLPLRARFGDAVTWPLMALFAVPAALLLLRLDRSADHPHLLRGRDDG